MSFRLRSYIEDGWRKVDYYDSYILPSGQTVKIEFQEDWTNKKYYYNIYLVTMHKRKAENNTCLKITGKDGLAGLLWAKKKVGEFEDFIKHEHEGMQIVIYCTWDDNRRRNIYERGLRNIGYEFSMIFGSKALCKTI